MIQNAAKDRNWMFRNFYILKDGEEADALQDGALSCAVFVSSILYLMNSLLEFSGQPRWLSYTHANVSSTEKDMLQNGWQEIKDLREGAVVIWEKEKAQDGNFHEHIGFCVGNAEATTGKLRVEAISNDSKGSGFPHRHHITYNGTRPIQKIYWHSQLDE